MLHYLAAIACLLGALLQIAVYRSPDVVDSQPSVTSARKITIIALLIAAGVAADIDLPRIISLVLGLLGLGQMMYAAHNLKLLDGTHA